MTNKQAASILKEEGCCQDCTFGGFPCKFTGCKIYQALNRAIELLTREGEWIIVNDVYCECPFCKNKEVKFSKCCPECGARLKGGAE